MTTSPKKRNDWQLNANALNDPSYSANDTKKTTEPLTPAMQLVEMFKDSFVVPEIIHRYHERLSTLVDTNPTAIVANNILHTGNGFSYECTNDSGIDGVNTQCIDHLLLPLLDSDYTVINTALLPPPDDKGIIIPPLFEPIRHAKGAFIIGKPFDTDNPADENAYLVTDIEAGINLYYLYPNATILICFTPANLAYVVKQWQFKAQGRLIVPIGCHLLEETKALLSDTIAIIYSMEYGIDFPLSNDEVKTLVEGANIYRLNTTDTANTLTTAEKKQLTWAEINERELFELLVNETGDPNTYPLEALPPLARHAVTAIAYHVQAPIAMAGQCVMGALSYLAQPYVNAYDRYTAHGKPCSLFILTEGGSGDRKSSCQRLADQRIYERQKSRLFHFHEDLEDYKNGMAKSRTAKQKADFMDNMPEPKSPQSLFKDATLEPIISTFIRGDVKDVAWTSDEAGQIFGGHTLKGDNRESALGALTSLWDRGVAERTRSKSNMNESGTAYDVRLTINTLGQKAILQSVLNDPVLREQGFLPRFLFSAPASLAGSRLHNSIESWKTRPYTDKRLVQYWQRCNELLDLPPLPVYDDKPSKRPVIPMSHEAEVMLLELYNTTESQMNKSGRYAHFKPFANRTVEHATRIATVLAFFEGIEAVTAELMTSGIKLAQYSLDEWERYNGFVEFDERLVEADRLENWLLAYCRDNEVKAVPKAKILQNVTPKHLRKANNFKKVLKILIDQNHAREIKVDGKGHIELNPKVFTDK